MSLRILMVSSTALLLCTCTVQPLTTSSGAVEVSRPARFPATVIGQTSSQLLGLTNVSRKTIRVVLSASAPFEVDAAVEVGAGSSVEVPLSFHPDHIGLSAGTLRTEQQEEIIEWPLEGEGLPPPRCEEAAACQVPQLSADQTTCTLQPSPDGTACSGPCLQDGQCLQGVCIGSVRACDDEDACTADACDAEAGCVHVDVSGNCPASNNPCLVAFCDRVTGCGFGAVADGTSCGPSDCSTSDVCIAGECLGRPTPEGTSCGETSPCQSRGVCKGTSCLQPSAHILKPQWSRRMPPGTRLDFPGAVDELGNLYWIECNTGCDLVSVTSLGVPRFRAPVFPVGTSLSAYNDFVLADGLVVIAEPGGDFVEAHDDATGALVWKRHLRQELDPIYLSGTCSTLPFGSIQSWPLVSDGRGQLVVFANVGGSVSCGSPHTKDVWAIALDTATGGTRWKNRYSVSPYHSNDVDAAFDEAGNLYATFHYPTPSEVTLLSLDNQGMERWRRSFPAALRQINGLFAGSLVLTQYQAPLVLIDTSTGQDRFSTRPIFSPGSALVDDTRALLFELNTAGAINLFTLSLNQGTSRDWLLRDTAGSGFRKVTTPVMTSRSSFLLASQSSTHWMLGEFDLNGLIKFECELESADYGSPTLRAGTWTAAYPEFSPNTVVSFALPGLEPAASGWVTARGKVTKEGRPR